MPSQSPVPVASSPSSGRRRRLPAVVGLSTAVAALVGTVTLAGMRQLPDGPGFQELQTVCGKCHSYDRAAALRLTAEGWDTVIADMMTRGAIGTPDEFQAVREYLVTNFLGEEPPPLNVNTASNLDLEAVAGLTRTEAAALRRWLNTSGPCLILEDLKQAEGVPYEKLESHRQNLLCFIPKMTPPPTASSEEPPAESSDQ